MKSINLNPIHYVEDVSQLYVTIYCTNAEHYVSIDHTGIDNVYGYDSNEKNDRSIILYTFNLYSATCKSCLIKKNNAVYKIPNYKELCKLAEDNAFTQRYDAVYSSFQQVPQCRTFILMINSVNDGKYDGEWVKIDGEWVRPDGSVPLYARAFSSGVLKR